MATRDLTYLIDFNVEGAAELQTAAGNMETLAEATNGVSETATLDLDLPEPSEIEDVGTAIGDLGADGGPVDSASEKAGGLAGAFGTMVNAIGLVQIGAAGADFVMGKIGERLDYIAETNAWEAGRVSAYADAILEVGEGVAAVEEVIRALADEPIQQTSGLFGLGGGSEIGNLTATLGFFGVNVQEVIDVIQGGGPELEAFNQRLNDVGATGDLNNQIMAALTLEQASYADGAAEAGYQAAFFSESQESANQALQELLTQRDPMSQFTSEWDLLKESMSDGSIDTEAAADALNTLSQGLSLTTDEVLQLAQADLDEAAAGALAFADALNSIDFQNADIEGATSAFSAYTDQLFSAANEAERRESAFDALAASAEEQALTFNLASEAGRAQSDALEAVARVIDEDLAQAYDNANGSQAEFVAAATQIGDETLARLQTELGLSAAQVDTLRNVLGLTEGDYEARFALAGAEEARIQLGLLSGAIEGLDAETEIIVTQQILAGDFVAARNTVANYYADNPVTLETQADTTGAGDDLQGVADDAPTATIVADADTFQAAADLLDAADEPRSALIVAHARTAGAEIDLAALADAERIAEIDVVTGSINMPSASQLVSLATGGQGRIVVPIVGRWSTRIEGSRPI